jgi:hypothetical protein
MEKATILKGSNVITEKRLERATYSIDKIATRGWD